MNHALAMTSKTNEKKGQQLGNDKKKEDLEVRQTEDILPLPFYNANILNLFFKKIFCSQIFFPFLFNFIFSVSLTLASQSVSSMGVAVKSLPILVWFRVL